MKIHPTGSEENNTESKRDSSASPTKLRRRRRSKSTEKSRENGTASSDKFRLDQSGSSSSESEDEGSMSEDEYSYSCVVYNKGDQEDSENMDPVSTCSNHYTMAEMTSIKGSFLALGALSQSWKLNNSWNFFLVKLTGLQAAYYNLTEKFFAQIISVTSNAVQNIHLK